MEVADLDEEGSILSIIGVEVAVCGPLELGRSGRHGQHPGASMSLDTLIVLVQSDLELLVRPSVFQTFAPEGAQKVAFGDATWAYLQYYQGMLPRLVGPESHSPLEDGVWAHICFRRELVHLPRVYIGWLWGGWRHRCG